MATSPASNPFRDNFQSRWLPLYFIALAVVVSGLAQSILSTYGLDIRENQVLFLAIDRLIWICTCAIALLQLRMSDINVSATFGRWPRREWATLALVLVLPVLMFSLGSGQLFFVALARWQPEFALKLLQNQVETPQLGDDPGMVLASVLTIAVLAPITEEFLFRGVLLNRWAAKWNMPYALIVNAILFGILHPNPIGLTIFSVVISLVYIKTGSLWLAIACHALNNGVAVILGFISPPAITDPEAMLEALSQDWAFGVACVALSIPLLLLFTIRNWPRTNAPLPYTTNLKPPTSGNPVRW